ncbi:MAG: hypothetical protein H6Q04_1534 [Acidobacteria bacterium]|nr:hypothetical protein [Acidobacteriota bacterium]
MFGEHHSDWATVAQHSPFFEFGKKNILFLAMMAPVHETSEKVHQLFQISRHMGGFRHELDCHLLDGIKIRHLNLGVHRNNIGWHFAR